MSRQCSVCRHQERVSIDKRLIDGESLGSIVSLFPEITKSALDRHKRSHLPSVLTKARQAKQVAQADGLLSQMQDLQGRTLDILQKAEKTDEHTVALRAISEARRNLELLGKVSGQLPADKVLIQLEPLITQVVLILQQEISDRETLERVSQRLLQEASSENDIIGV